MNHLRGGIYFLYLFITRRAPGLWNQPCPWTRGWQMVMHTKGADSAYENVSVPSLSQSVLRPLPCCAHLCLNPGEFKPGFPSFPALQIPFAIFSLSSNTILQLTGLKLVLSLLLSLTICTTRLGLPQQWPQTGSLKQQKWILTVPEARSLKSRCRQGHAPREESFFASFGFWYFRASLAFLGLKLRHSDLCLCCLMAFFPMCLCVSVSQYPNFSPLRHPSYWI